VLAAFIPHASGVRFALGVLTPDGPIEMEFI
jgi:hypothetical protein